MKKTVLLISISVLSFLFLFINTNAQAKFVGVKMCGACHKGEKNKNVFEKWSASDHSKAFETLKNNKSKEIAKKMGISDPSASDKCLSCHVTNLTKKEEGISCESCHGAGSDYKAKTVMEKRELAKQKGLILGKGDADLCKKCHNQKSPTYKPFDYKIKWEIVKHPTK
ncbi:MAG: cytochrome c family protein [Ignavibacteriales bacterium]|nr:cytochrome c family protein [Ignavibacteriales bacterium]